MPTITIIIRLSPAIHIPGRASLMHGDDREDHIEGCRGSDPRLPRSGQGGLIGSVHRDGSASDPTVEMSTCQSVIIRAPTPWSPTSSQFETEKRCSSGFWKRLLKAGCMLMIINDRYHGAMKMHQSSNHTNQYIPSYEYLESAKFVNSAQRDNSSSTRASASEAWNTFQSEMNGTTAVQSCSIWFSAGWKGVHTSSAVPFIPN